MTVGNNIRRLRVAAGLKQEDLAKMVGVARSTVAQWERNWATPGLGNIRKIADAFGVSMNVVVSGSEEMPTLSEHTRTSSTVPLVTLGRVHAGSFCEADETTRIVEVPPRILRNHPNAQAAVVEGDCMNRIIPEGMAVVFDSDQEPQNNDIVIVETEDHEMLLRHWHRAGNTLVLVADSYQDYEDIVLSWDTPIRLIGTVVWAQPLHELA
ncbi:MAG: helix-turn-helix domain-containing protein [Atopobiaceae bacterium]|nr:helix-turn-helix domain-containing protein [Atopobiaceae bacterium]